MLRTLNKTVELDGVQNKMNQPNWLESKTIKKRFFPSYYVALMIWMEFCFVGSFYLVYHLVCSLCTGLIFKATKLALNENLHKAPVFLMSLVDKDHQVSRPRSEEWRGRARILWGLYALWSLHIISIKLTSIKLDKNSNIFTTAEQEGEVLFTQAILYIVGDNILI